uniref:DEK-C domain-containing protein n=1 Tax=Pseudo-nitzschia australis TaxID=44445 RepID=A0A7S4ALD8_9STRA|mmetsp:Transcript_18217/g.39713  ORF Transcript_18217/g.39713 Transcript_18217/m.39713 type:complete len:299 (+) Transcript_18217:83-979(+)
MRPKKKSEVASKELADNEGVEGENVDEEDKDVYDVNNGRGKRKRRESKSYEPDDFTMSSYNAAVKASAIAVGRGKKLGEIAAVKSSINMYKLNTEELLLAYKFVFSNRGTAKKKSMREKLLEFSGYLPPIPKGKYDEERQDEEDKVFETKYATKAFKMNVSQIKTLCVFFSVDYSDKGGKPLKKDAMIDRLLDFLGEPDESLAKKNVSSDTKKKTGPKSKKKRIARDITEAPFSLIRDYKKGKLPSDDAMRQWVKAYVVCIDMETATTKDAVQTATAKFGVDMVIKKARIKELLAEEI